MQSQWLSFVYCNTAKESHPSLGPSSAVYWTTIIRDRPYDEELVIKIGQTKHGGKTT